MNRLFIIALLLACTLLMPSVRAADTPQSVFDQRILPIFKSPNPSSCVQCHLTGVDLKDYILPSAEKTFRSLRDQGLIDLATPEKSKILALITMGSKDAKTPAVHATNRKAEYEAFAAWIKACAADETLRTSPKLDESERAIASRPVEVIRHSRKDRMLESFERNVWSMRFRCMNCHTEGTPQNVKYVKEYGEKVAWVKKAGAEATMDYLIASKLIDPKEPEKSLLLQKPLGTGTVKHEGGIKFASGDQAHKSFWQWVEDVAAIKTGKYAKAADLPSASKATLAFGTEAWLKLTNTPEAWGDKLLQVNVYAWEEKAKAWERDPVATSDRIVYGKGKLWQHTITLLAEPGSDRAKTWSTKASLPPGRYLLMVFVDKDERLKKDWKAEIREDDFAGQVEIRGIWKLGYDQMTTGDATAIGR